MSYFTHLVLVVEPVNWLLLRPLVALRPTFRRSLVGPWMRFQAQLIMWLAQRVGGMRLSIEGEIPPASCVVVMNHQSLLDIPLALSMIAGPYPLIPTRASYRYGIPGVSSMIALANHPLVEQGRIGRRAELKALLGAADEVAGGKQSFLIFPEGHRSLDGEILPFMSAGLKLVLARVVERPIYVIVADGLWTLRSFSDVALRLAGTSVRAIALGPYTIPPEREKQPEFVEFLRRQMIEGLARLRVVPPEKDRLAAEPQLAG